MMNLLDGSCSKCCLLEVMFVPSLSYNLLSVSKATEKGKEAKFDKDGCKIVDKNGRIIATTQRRGNLSYLDCRAAEHATITQQ